MGFPERYEQYVGLNSRMAKAANDLGMPAQKLSYLAFLARQEETISVGTTAIEFSEEMGGRGSVAPSRISVIVGELGDKELVSQTIDTVDKRKRYIEITPEGRKVVDRLMTYFED